MMRENLVEWLRGYLRGAGLQDCQVDEVVAEVRAATTAQQNPRTQNPTGFLPPLRSQGIYHNSHTGRYPTLSEAGGLR